jgi:hypothetical protein
MFKTSVTNLRRFRAKCDCCAKEATPTIITPTDADADADTTTLGPLLGLAPPPGWVQISTTTKTRHLCTACAHPHKFGLSVRFLMDANRWV